ncbi:hypothetical protein Tco_0471305 [Tanacetum coccineum]
MDGCTKGPQLEEDENLNIRAPGTGRTPPGGTSVPADKFKEAPLQHLSRSRGRSRSARKHQKSVSRKKWISKSHRLVRSEARSRSKSKSVKSKPQSVRASRRKSSSDSGYDIVSDSGLEDLSMPYRRPKPMPFTSRITRFRYHRWAKHPPNVRVYEGNKDLEDHLRIFFRCSRARRVAYASVVQDVLPELEWFGKELQKRYDKDPTEIHDIKRKPNEGLQAFMDRFKAESAHIKGVPTVLRIFAFMHGHDHPELAKKLNDKIPKTVDEMWERFRAFIRGEPKSSDLLSGKRVLVKLVSRKTRMGLEIEVIEGGKEETWGLVLLMLGEKASHP